MQSTNICDSCQSETIDSELLWNEDCSPLCEDYTMPSKWDAACASCFAKALSEGLITWKNAVELAKNK